MRRVLIILAVVVVLGIVGVLALPSLLNVDKYRPQIQAELQKKLERPVTLGQLTLHLFPLSIGIDGMTIGEAPAFNSPRPFATAKDVTAEAELFSLFGGSPVIKSVALIHPQIEIIHNADGVWNYSTLGPQGQSSSSDSKLTLDELKIEDGQVGLTDRFTNQPRSEYDHIDLKLTDFAPNKPFHVNLGVRLPGEGKQQLSLDAKVGPLVKGNAAATPVDGRLTLQEVSLAGVTRFMNGAVPPNTNSLISGETSLKTEANNISAKGSLKLANTIVKGTKIDYPVTADYDLTVDRAQDVVQIRSGQLKLGSTPFSVNGQLNMGKASTLNMHVTTNNAPITELAKLAGSFGVAFNPSYQVQGTVTANITAQGAMKSPALNGTVSASQVRVAGGEIKQPVEIPAISVALSPESLRSNPFTAQSGSTRVNVAFTLSQYTTKNSNIDATVRTDNASIADLLDMAKAYGVDSSKGATGTGTLSLNVHVQGPTAVPAKLVYAGSGQMTNVTVTSPTLTKPLIVSTATIQFAQNSAGFTNLAASIASTSLRGSMSVKDFSAPEVQFNLTADRLNTTELQQLSRKSTAPSAGNTNQPHSNNGSLLDKVTGGGTFAANTIIANELVLNNVHATCKLNRGIIQLSPVTADLYSGKENGTITLDTRPATPTCAVKTKLTGVDTNQLLSAVSSVKNTLYGSLAADANLGFTLGSSAELTRTLNGELAFNVTNGQLKNVNILNELSKVGRFTGAAPTHTGNATALKKLAATLNIKDGVANTNNLVAALDEGSLSGEGLVNLVDQGINMKVTAVLTNGISTQVGGAKVGGFLNTALANNKGELVIPVMVTGSLAKPTFTPDVNAIAQMKLKNLLPSAGNPGQLTTGLLGSALGNKGSGGIAGGLLKGLTGGQQTQQPQPGQQANPNQPQQNTDNPIDSIIGAFGKKKQPKQK